MVAMPHKLLLADDSVTIQRVIELTFADEDVQVIAVGNGQQAIERAERDRPDIVLADVGMPERDGYEVAAFIKGHPTLSSVPVVLLTGAFEPIDESRAKAVGCDGVLVKPFEPQMVISRVKDLLAGRKPAGLWGSGPAAQGPVRPAAADIDVRPTATTSNAVDPLEAYFDRLDAAFNAMGTGDVTAAAPLPRPDPAPPASAPASQRQPIPVATSQAPAAPPPAPRRHGPLDLSSWDPELTGDPAPPAPPPAPPPVAVAAPPPSNPRPAPLAPPVPPPAPVLTPFPLPPAQSAPASPPSAPASASSPEAAPPAAPAAPAPPLADAFAALLSAEENVGISPSAAPAHQSAATLALTDDLIDEITRRVVARLSDQTRPSVLDVAERIVREEIERIKQQAR